MSSPGEATRSRWARTCAAAWRRGFACGTDVTVLAQGALPRQEVGKARRVWERLDDGDPLAV